MLSESLPTLKVEDFQVERWHSKKIEQVEQKVETHLEMGLSKDVASSRLREFGPNELMEKKGRTLAVMLFDQFKDVLILILIAAVLISGALGEFLDASAIFAIVILNAVLGVMQERKAEKSLQALKRLAAPVAQVIRDGKLITIPTREIVPGDLVLLQTGDRVSADVRLVESVNLKIDEAALTGESLPVEKDALTVLSEGAAIGDRRNMAFMGTVVTYGRGKGIVVATGMRTEMGKIAEMLQSVKEEPTPLQVKLNRLGKWLSAACLVVCALVFLAGLLRGEAVIDMFMTAVSLAVAAIPEGLPAIVTIVLALGVTRMVKRNAIIRKLPDVETLGCATIICSDKTGTLTQNKMQVTTLYFPSGSTITVTGNGYEPVGEFYNTANDKVDPNDAHLQLLLRIGALCNDALLQQSENPEQGGEWNIAGDPTEGALVVLTAKAGGWKTELETEYPRISEIPFDSERKRMSTFHRMEDDKIVAYVKGAPDVLLERCSFIEDNGQLRELDAVTKEEIYEQNSKMAASALRVLAAAYRPFSAPPEELSPDAVENELIFVGLWGMIDAPRPQVKDAVRICHEASIKPIMITGDYRLTAQAIAEELGITEEDALILTGAELDNKSDAELKQLAKEVVVYARVSPEHKMRIVNALRENGHIVAMTGDGVNDAPALKKADIGVAMGITGTDVAKETADMVLTDDNFASIVGAVEEGRAIFDNIRRFTLYLLSCNLGEILIVFLPIMAGFGRPLEPIQILWINLLTDGLPALALGVEPPEKDIMRRPPRHPKEGVFTKTTSLVTLLVGCLIAAAVLGAYLVGLRFWTNKAQTIAFSTLMLAEMWRAFSNRSETRTIFQLGFFSNKHLLWAVGASLLLLAVVIFVPALHAIFKTGFLTLRQWGVVVGFSFLPAFLIEMTKVIVQRWNK
jgi:Ca2+-transporting ATPase